MNSEIGMSYEKYIQQVLIECNRMSHWPVLGKETSTFVEYDGYCPFDMTPGYIERHLGEFPSWALSFQEKMFKSENSHCFSIQLPIEPYKDLVAVTNVNDENVVDWDNDITLGDFLGEEGDKLYLERELLELGEGWPKILIERLVAVASDGQIAVWGLTVIRELAYFEEGEDEIEQVVHLFGVEAYTEGEYGIEQNWYREWMFNRKIDTELLILNHPIFPIVDSELIGPITKRNAVFC